MNENCPSKMTMFKTDCDVVAIVLRPSRDGGWYACAFSDGSFALMKNGVNEPHNYAEHWAKSLEPIAAVRDLIEGHLRPYLINIDKPLPF